MQAFNSVPLLLTAPAPQAGVSKSYVPRNWGCQKLQGEEPGWVWTDRHCLLPVAQLEGVQVFQEASPSPSLPIQSPKISDFILVSLGLLLVFWVGNFIVPDYILKKMGGPDAEHKDAGKQAIISSMDASNGKSSDAANEDAASVGDGAAGRGFGKVVKRASTTRRK